MTTISCQQRPFGNLENGETITCYSLRSTSGMVVDLLNYGASLNAVQIPDSRGKMHEIVKGNVHSNTTIAHLASRYSFASKQLTQSLWNADIFTQEEKAGVVFTLSGTLNLRYPFKKTQYRFKTEYTLNVANELVIQSRIETSESLPLFLTHNPIWNLVDDAGEELMDHILQIWSQNYTTLDLSGFPGSSIHEIQEEAAFDFRQPQRIGEKRNQLLEGTDYDTCFMLNNTANTEILAARIKAPVSGRTLEVYTSQAGLRFYLNKNQAASFDGFCLSPMPLLSSINHSVSQGTHFHQTTRYKLIW